MNNFNQPPTSLVQAAISSPTGTKAFLLSGNGFTPKLLRLSSFAKVKRMSFSSISFFLLFAMMLSTLNLQAQQVSKQQQFEAVTEAGSELEFFTIKPELNIAKEDFVRNYLHILNLTPGSEMRFVRSETNDIGITSTLYQQYFNNIKVKGAEMMLSEKAGRVKYVHGRYMTTAPANTDVVIKEETALATSLKEVKSVDYLWLLPEAEAAYKRFKKDENASYTPKGELMYMPNLALPFEQQNFRLVWNYAIHVSPQIESYEFFIDATTGEIINRLPLTYECSAGTGTTLWNGVQTLYTFFFGSPINLYYSFSDCNSAQVITYNGNGGDDIPGSTYYTDANNTWPNTALYNYFAQTHWSTKETRDYYAAVHGREGYDDAGADYVSIINAGFTSNAYWTGTNATFGGTSTGADPYITLDVAGHEHTHGMIDYTSNLTYSYESGALNESFADCIGEAVEGRALGTPDWEHRFEIGGGNRSFTDPNSKGDPDTYLGDFWYIGSGDNGGVHTNSGVQNRWFYVLSVGHSGTNDNGHAYNVSAIGINKARLIAYDCMIGLISSSQYTNARSVSIQKAKDRYGDCANEVVQTTNAWRAVGVGAAYVPPTPLTISVATSATFVCSGSPVTITAFGASTYAWDPGTTTGNPAIFNPVNTTTYTVTGTNAESCTGTKTFTIKVNPVPTVTPTANDNELCPGQSTTISAGTNQTLNSLITQLTGTSSSQGNAFDIHAYNSITITDFKMNIATGDSAEVWYNVGGYGNANVTTNTGWSKLGATVAITAAGVGNMTTIPTTSNLTISAGSTYGIIVICNGNNRYSVGTTVGAIAESNTDLYLTQGHAGTGGFGGTFNMTFSPRIFDGEIVYRVNYTDYAWTPSATLTSPTSSSTTASPASSTQYTLTATDGNGCTNTGLVKVYLYQNPSIGLTTATPSTICAGGTSQLSNIPFLSSSSQSLFTTLIGGNGNSANMFDVHALNNITITNVRMNILSGDSAQIWYKTSPYGNSNVTSSTGWIKLGNTVAITPAGAGALTLISTSANLVIPAGSTYGLAVICNGSNNYTNGTTVGAVAYSSPDLEITEGHGGTGFNGAFNFINFPRVFNGQIDYTVTNNPMTYFWSPSSSLSSSSISNPVADPHSTTNYTVTLTDAHGCKDTSYKKLFVDPKPQVQVSVAPVLCPGDSAQITTTVDVTETDSLFTTLEENNGSGGNAFNIVTTKAITIKGFKMHLTSGTQAEIWYKAGGYGNANFTGTAGWTKLGATITVVAAGLGNLTNVIPSAFLSIPSGQAYGFMLVTNGGVEYLDGLTAVGTTYVSNPDISITVGHGGTGIGLYSFTNSPRVWNGEVTYDVNNGPVTYSWSPNTNMNNGFIANPKAAPLSTTTYTVTATSAGGCTATGVAGVVVAPQPQLGTATATPASLCLGGNVSLVYTQPAASGCYGGYQGGFAGVYAPANWTLALVNSNGTVNTALAPNSITLTSSNGMPTGAGQTNYSHAILCTGIVSFDWEYNTTDGAQYDAPRYSLNGINFFNFPNYQSTIGDPKQQIGTFTLPVTAGQTITIQAYSSDNIGGACSIKLSNFKAPYQTFAGQTVVWYSAPSGGSNLGNGNPQLHAPATASNFIYYAQITSTVTTCTNPTRVATNLVQVSAIPTVGTTASATTICAGSSTTLTGTGALTYTWNPGGLSGTSVVVSPAATTTYTVVGTNAAGCTASATRLITVLTVPAISGSASPGIVCPGGAVTLIGTNGAGTTYNWQPGNLNTASGVGVVVNPLAQTTYTVTATFSSGCTRSQTFVVLMHPTPTVTTSVAPSATFCAGGNATITANGAVSYAWAPGGGSGANLIVTLANTYTVTGTNAQGCTGTATRVITVNPLPTVGTTVTNATICAGSSTSITGTGAAAYVWNPGGLGGTTINVSPASTTTYTVIGTNANGCTNTATRLITVLTAPTIGTTVTSASIPCGGSTTITGTGGVTYAWMPGSLTGTSIIVSPLVTTTYTVTGTAANGCTKTATRTITVAPCGATVNVKVFIEGYYIGGGLMDHVMQNQGVVGATPTMTDTITVQLRNSTFPFAAASTIKTILNTNGTAVCNFPISGTYYLAVTHRNGLQTWSAAPMAVGGAPVSYDFSNAAIKAYGANQAFLDPGVFGIYSGDFNLDENIDLLDLGDLEADISGFASGYMATDVNGDGNVDLLDAPLVEAHIAAFVFTARP